MRRRRGRHRARSPSALIALVVTLIGVYLGFTKSIPFRHHYEIKAAFESANNLRKASPVRIAGVEVGKVTKVERAHQGDDGALVTMRIQDKGRPLHADATVQDPPAHLPRGQLLRRRRRPARRRRTEVADGHDVPGQPDRHAGPARPGADRAAVRHARGPQDAAARVRRRRSRARARKGFNALDPVLEAAPTATRRSSPRRCWARTEHDLSGYINNARRRRPARSTATASRSRT